MGRVPVAMSPGLDEARLRRLVEFGAYVTAELDVEAVLHRVLEVGREITGAKYAALGILNKRKHGLERFLTLGIPEHTRREIGDLPRGRGVLGLLIEEPRAVRMPDISRHPRSYGFPLAHPPMRSFLGVPIMIRKQAFGNLYLTEKEDGTFDQSDEDAVGILAEWAGIAIEHARLYEEAEARRHELEHAVHGLEATVAISRAVGGETDLSRVLELIAKRARSLVGARALAILLEDRGQLRIAATAGELPSEVRGDSLPLPGTVAQRVMGVRRAERIADVADRMPAASQALHVQAQTALVVPLAFRGRALGVLEAFDRMSSGPDFSSGDERLLQSFAASAATAVATAQSVEQVRLAQRIKASEEERRRWARELHDDTLQGLGAVGLMLSSAARSSDEELRGAVAGAIKQLNLEIESLRMLVTELRPAALDELGLRPALEALIDRAAFSDGIEVRLRYDVAREHGDASARLAPDIESTVYRVVQEALNNALHHANATVVDIVVTEGDGALTVTVTDDGCGFDPAQPTTGFGLVGMRERIELVDGRLELDTTVGTGTRVRASVPVGRADPSPPPVGQASVATGAKSR
ncbi:MAG: GAF domain-containing protein [Solirubrobacteraceae bacterium]